MTVAGKGGRPKRGAPKEWDKYWDWPNSPWKSGSSFMAYLRSALRRAWLRNPAKLEKIRQGKIKIPNPNPKSATRFPEIFGAKCECCGGEFPLSMGKKEAKNKDFIVVDHKHPAGEFKEPKDFQKFFTGLLLITPDDLRLLCTTCNADFLYVQKNGGTLEEAKAERFAISLQKERNDVEWLQERGLSGKNATVRRKMIVEQVMKESGND